MSSYSAAAATAKKNNNNILTFTATSVKQGENEFVLISWQVVHIILIIAFRARVEEKQR